MAAHPTRPIRIAIANDYEIVVAGIAAALLPFSARVEVVELDSGALPSSDVDIVLYDTFGRPQGDACDVAALAATGAKVVVFGWNRQPHLVTQALERGAAGYLAKSLTGEEIADALERVHAGERVCELGGYRDAENDDADFPTWPAREHGLSPREAEVLALITQGLSNQEIAERCYLSVNSIKTYIRTAYRKLGITSRSQAVLWGINNGLNPDHSRLILSADPGSATEMQR